MNPELSAFAKDAVKFVKAFYTPIAHSAPHIYISALPFTPSKSLVSRCFTSDFPRTLQVQRGRMHNWPNIVNVLEDHMKQVTSVAFSPNGKHIASGSDDCTVRVWDAESGQVVSGPFKWHTNQVNSAVFSPDGKHMVCSSGYQIIQMGDTYPSKVVTEAFERHKTPLASTASTDLCDNHWKQNNGWIYCNNHGLLFWVPPSHRTGLWRPRNTLVIDKHSTRLELSQFVYGMAWAQCWKYQTSST